MTNAELNTQAAYFTEAQAACRIARDTCKDIDLQKAAALLDSPRMASLPKDAQSDLFHAYAVAVHAQGGLVG